MRIDALEEKMGEQLLTHPDPDIRIQIAMALGTIREDLRVNGFRSAFRHEDDPVVAEAMIRGSISSHEFGIDQVISEWLAGPSALDPILLYHLQVRGQRTRRVLHRYDDSRRLADLRRHVDGPTVFESERAFRDALRRMPRLDRSADRASLEAGGRP